MPKNRSLFNFAHLALQFSFQLMFLVTPFVFTWVNDELFEFNKMLFVYGLTALTTSLWLSKMVLAKKIIYRHHWLNFLPLLFLLSQVISTLFSIEPRTSFFGYYTRFNGGLLSIICYSLLYLNIVSNLSRSAIKKLIWTLVISAGLSSLYAIPEHFGHSPSCWLITGDFNVDCWVQDVQNRIFGTFGQPNWLAAFAVSTLPLSLFLVYRPIKKNKPALALDGYQLLALTSFVLLTLTTLFTQSRSGFISLLAGSLLYLSLSTVILSRQNKTIKSNQIQIKQLQNFWPTIGQLIALPISLFLIIVLTFGSPYTAPIWKKTLDATPITSPTPSAGNSLEIGGTDSGEIRKIVWEGALKVWQRYPLFGSGVETFAYAYYQDRPMRHNLVSEWDFLYNKAHNEFLNFLATTGVVGLGCYLLLLAIPSTYGLIWVFNNCNKIDKQSDQLLLIAVISGLVAMSISNFLGFSTVMVNVMLFFFLAVITSITNPSQTDDQQNIRNLQERKLDPATSFQLIIIFLILLGSLNWIYQTWLADKYYAIGKNQIQSAQYFTGLQYLQEAIKLSPKEPFFSDELADLYSKMAVQYGLAGEATQASQLASAAVQTSQYTLKLNQRNINFYKTQSRIYINLSQLNLEFLHYAKQSLQDAIALAPTDAKLMYNLGIVEIGLEENEQGLTDLRKAIEMKPNYAAARLALAKQLESQADYQGAIEQYQYILEKIVPDSQEVAERLRTAEASRSAREKATEKPTN
ncbi:MAG: O-antigen ligase family protein [Patescibacteria group bacterium]